MYIYKHPDFVIPKEFQDGLVGAWDGQHNGDTVIDISGNGNNGTQTDVVFSRKNNARQMSFNGSSSKVDIDGLGFSGEHTFSGLFKVSTSGQDNKGIFIGYDGANDSFGFGFSSGYIEYRFRDGDKHIQALKITDILNKYVFCVGLYDGTNIKVYLNGILIDTKAVTGEYTWSNTKIGYHGGGYGEFEGGLLSIYNKALTPQQISKMYEYFRQWYYN